MSEGLFTPFLAQAWYERGESQARLGQTAKAREAALRAHALASESGAEELAAASLVQLAFIDGYDRGKLELAEAWAQAARPAIARAQLTGEYVDFALENALGASYRVAQDSPHALEHLRKSLTLLEASGSQASTNYARALSNYAGALNDSGKHAEALPLLQQALEAGRRALPPGHPDVATYLNNLGAAHANLHQDAQAERCFLEALQTRQALLPRDHPQLATSYANLGRIRARQGKLDDALAALTEALRVATLKDPHDLLTYDPRMGLADVLLLRGDAPAARTQAQEALAVARGHGALPAYVAPAQLLLADARLQGGAPRGEVLALVAAARPVLEGDAALAEHRERLEAVLVRLKR